MHMASKAEQIRQMSRDGASASDIAEEVGTSRGYVYKVRSAMSDDAETETEPDVEQDAGDVEQATDEDVAEVFEEEETEERDLPDAGADLDADTVEEDRAEAEEEQLELEDTGGKSYECGACGDDVEYLDKRCDGCGEQLMWSAIEGGA